METRRTQTRRMERILLILLHPERVYQWLEKSHFYFRRLEDLNYFPQLNIILFCMKRARYLDASVTFSFEMTLGYMMSLGLIDERSFSSSHNAHEYKAYKLTDEGRRIAEKIEREMKGFIEDFEFLTSPSDI